MRINLLKKWRQNGSYQDNNGVDYGEYWAADSWDFDTDTLSVVFTAFPAGGSYRQELNIGGLPPEDFSLDIELEFYVSAKAATRTGWFHDGEGGTTTTAHTITATAEVEVVRCNGPDRAGSALLTLGPDSPTGAYTYLWNDGATTLSRPRLAGGYYSVLIRHESGAELRLPVTVAEYPPLSVVIDKTDARVTLRVSGGLAPYAYEWEDDPNETTETRTGLAAGTYVCTITDELGCQTTVIVEASAFRYYFVRNPIALALDAGAEYRADPASLPSLTFVCQVLVERDYLSGVFELVGTQLEQPADRDGRTTFQVQRLLAPELDYHIPAASGPVGERATSLFRRFYLRHAPVSGEPPVPGLATELVQHYVLLGGLSRFETAARTWFNSYQPGVKPFLTWEPNDKHVLADQPEFLYFQSLDATTTLYCRARVRLRDGADRLLDLHIVRQVSRFEVFCFSAGYQVLVSQLTPDEQARVIGWQMEVVDANQNLLSEYRRYTLDRRVLPLRRYLLYANSLGGMNTFVATGEAQFDAELSGDQVTLTATLDYDTQRGDTAVLERELKPVLKLASGLRLGSAAHLALQELLLSRRVLLLNSGRWLPGYLKTKTVNLLDDGKPVPTLEVELVLAAEQQFTPYLPPTPAGTTPAAVGPDSGRL